MRSFRNLAKGVLRRTLARVAPTEVETALRFLRSPSSPAFPKKNVVVERNIAAGRVLVLAPHPDDEAIGAGGTLIAQVRGGSEVCVLYLTDGGGVGEERGEQIATRRAEARATCRELGAEAVFWDNPDTRLTNGAANVEALASLLRDREPDRVFVPSFFDTHYDHFATNQILVDAVARGGWRGTICGYEVWDAVPFPNYLVDVSPHIEERDALLANYRTPHATTDFTRLCRYRSSIHYTLFVNSHKDRMDLGYAEAFLRFDSDVYCDMQRSYVQVLREAKSPLVTHIS